MRQNLIIKNEVDYLLLKFYFATSYVAGGQITNVSGKTRFSTQYTSSAKF